jgi:hypothetical protein
MRRLAVVAAAVVAAAGSAVPLAAQASDPVVDASAFAGQGTRGAAVSGVVRWRLFGGRVAAGLGARVTGYVADPLTLRYRGGIATTNGDTLTITDPRVVAVNLLVSGDVRVVGPVGLGANLDVAGLAFGPERAARFGTGARPRSPNLFKGGASDLGSLHSEFYVSARVLPRLTVRAGASHFVLGYEVVGAPGSGSDANEPRYNLFRTAPFVALRWGD